MSCTLSSSRWLRTQLKEHEMADPDPNAWENALIADMRANGGEVTMGPLAGESLLLMTTMGRKTGHLDARS